MRRLLWLTSVTAAWAVPLAHLNASAVAESLLDAGFGDQKSRAFAASEIVRRDLNGRALQQLLQNGGGEVSMWLARSLSASEGVDGSVLQLVNWLQQGVSELPQTCGSSSRKLSESPQSEEAQAAAASTGSHSDREAALQAFLLQDYKSDIAPDMAQVQVGINFFKITEIDLKSSRLVMPVWFRLQWKDDRLKFNASLWNLSGTYLKAQQHSSSSDIWTPDIEIYNAVESIQSTLDVQQASLSPDGTVWWSRSGQVIILCKFKGLRNYPLDVLSCTLELGAWSRDKGSQDLIFRLADGGYNFPTKDGSDTGTSSTAGSTFQDYRIDDVTVSRTELLYDCCPHAFPQLLFNVKIKRASTFYTLKLIAPQIAMAGVSYITYFMNPDIGERLGFGITLVLAVLATDIVATEFMPVCEEVLLMNYISWLCLMVCIFALFESGIVLTFHHLDIMDLQESLPFFLRRRCFRSRDASLSSFEPPPGMKRTLSGRLFRSSKIEAVQAPSADEDFDACLPSAVPNPNLRDVDEESVDEQSPRAEQEIREDPVIPLVSPSPGLKESTSGKGLAQDSFTEINQRRHMYQEAFYILDEDFSGLLERDEVNLFGKFMLGDHWNEEMLNNFMQSADHDNSGGLTLLEFSDFCERCLLSSAESKELNYLSDMIKAFLSFTQIRRDMVKCKWQQRAKSVDTICRVLIPVFGFLPFVFILSVDFEGEGS